MPELPEVEEVRCSLHPLILHRRILAVSTPRPDFITPPGVCLDCLPGHRFVNTLRHGKKLFCLLDDDQTLHFHLGMTGYIHCCDKDLPPEPHTHFTLTLDQNLEFRFSDPRRFGGVWYYPTFKKAWDDQVTNRLGPDAISLQTKDLAHWRSAPGRLKARLLAQRDVAGLGNIYVDESLWMAHLHPLQLVSRITPKQLQTLVRAIKSILNRSISLGGTTIRDYRNANGKNGEFSQRLRVYGRAGLPCLRCQTPLSQQTIATRTTVFCPQCQPRR